jgi:hypothetical protein
MLFVLQIHSVVVRHGMDFVLELLLLHLHVQDAFQPMQIQIP